MARPAGLASRTSGSDVDTSAPVYRLVTRPRANLSHGTFKKSGGLGMGALPALLAEAVAAADLVQLRRQKNPEQAISRAEAEALLTLDRRQRNCAASWRDFIADAIADHLTSVEPTGIVTPEKADWLVAALAPAGDIDT